MRYLAAVTTQSSKLQVAVRGAGVAVLAKSAPDAVIGLEAVWLWPADVAGGTGAFGGSAFPVSAQRHLVQLGQNVRIRGKRPHVD